MTRVLVVGNGGREHALAAALADEAQVHVFAAHRNPGLVAASEGRLQVGDVRDGERVAAYARESAIDLAIVSADEPLAAGVVDVLRASGIRTVGPDRRGAQIEWDKSAARQLVDEIAPALNPFHVLVRSEEELEGAFAAFDDRPMVVKPAGLSGGKGVKVEGPHLADRAASREYAASLLAGELTPRAVILEERIDAIEFTIQAFSDGRTCVFPPATFDYPYRYDGDHGAGTGGMGCYTAGAGPLPFLDQAHYDEACAFIEQAIAHWTGSGRSFSGVLNTGFFVTAAGLKLIEFNARFGDPEAINVMGLLRSSALELMDAIADARLDEVAVEFDDAASNVTYLVAPEYPARGPAREFALDLEAIEAAGATVRFGACERLEDGRYRSTGSSRVLAICAVAGSLAEAHDRVSAGIARGFDGPPVFEWREDIGQPDFVERQVEQVESLEPAQPPLP